jgi:acyl-coenzyme A thioesterase PaaI-like protein
MSPSDKPRRAPGAELLALWRRCASLPFGRTLFDAFFAMRVPYSGALGARVRTLEPGHAVVELRDRRGVRNHLGSVHAIALANLGEMASGLAMTMALPAHVRGIVRGIAIDYDKKARGTLVAESRVTVPEVTGDTDFEVRAIIRDAVNDTVATVRVTWRLGPVPGSRA